MRAATKGALRAMLAAAVLPLLASGAPGERLDKLTVSAPGPIRHLTWQDADDSVTATFRPGDPAAGETLDFNIRVQPIAGAAYDGPVALALRAPDGRTQVLTLTPKDGEWRARVPATQSGPHALSLSFRTTRHKVIYGSFDVRPAGPPRYLAYVMFGIIGAFIAGLLLALARQMVKAR